MVDREEGYYWIHLRYPLTVRSTQDEWVIGEWAYGDFYVTGSEIEVNPSHLIEVGTRIEQENK